MVRTITCFLAASIAFVSVGCGGSGENSVPEPNSERPAKLDPEQLAEIKKSMEEASQNE